MTNDLRYELSMQLVAEWRERIAALDARSAPDRDYRWVFSSLNKRPLRKKETWRGRAIRTCEREERSATRRRDQLADAAAEGARVR